MSFQIVILVTVLVIPVLVSHYRAPASASPRMDSLWRALHPFGGRQSTEFCMSKRWYRDLPRVCHVTVWGEGQL